MRVRLKRKIKDFNKKIKILRVFGLFSEILRVKIWDETRKKRVIKGYKA